MSRKLVFLPCLPWDSAALGDWANGLARDGLEPRRIPAALPFLAVVGDGPACTYTVEPAHGAKRDGCRVPWVGSRIVRGRPAGKYPYGGARRRVSSEEVPRSHGGEDAPARRGRAPENGLWL